MLKKGLKFFWNKSIFPYVITNITTDYIYYKREGYAEKRVYKDVFENDITQNRIEFITQ